METRDAAQRPTVQRTAPTTVIESKMSIMVRLTNSVLELSRCHGRPGDSEMGRKKGGQNPHLLCMELRRRHRTCALAHERLHEHVRLRTRAETQRLRLSTRAGTQCGRLRTSAGTHVCACARAPARNVIAHARRHTLYACARAPAQKCAPAHARRHRTCASVRASPTRACLHAFGSRPARDRPVCACACVLREGARLRSASVRLRAPPFPAALSLVRCASGNGTVHTAKWLPWA